MNITAAESSTSPGTTGNTGLIAYFAGNPVAANLLMLLLIVGGLAAGSRLVIQHLPPIDFRTINVTVDAPGISPQEVEQDINRRIEESVIGLAGVERVVSTAREGQGRVAVELATFADPESVRADVENAINGIEYFPPLNAEQPEVEIQRVALEVMTLSVSSSLLSENELRLAAEELRDRLLELPSVSQVTLLGTRDREISIELSEEELRRNQLSFRQIANAVERASVNLTFGELRTEAGGIVLQTVAKRQVGDEFEDIPIITRLDGSIVRLGDVAEIRDGFVDEDIRTEVDGAPAVLVRIGATEKQSIADLGEDITRWLATYRPPEHVRVGVWNDRAEQAVDRIARIVRNGVIGAVLVFVCLVLVFDLRTAFWIALGIPISFVGALMFFGMGGLTLNMGTVLAFFLLIGIVVDDAVVVGESIATEREGGKNALEAAISGARAMVGPITIGVLTTILGFLPLLFVTAGNYQMVKVFPYVAFFVLAVSLIESFLILPAHLSHQRRWSLSPLREIQKGVRERLDALREGIVVPAVSWSVRHISWTLIGGLAVVSVAVFLLRSESVRWVMFDKTVLASESIQADLHLPVGTPFSETLAAAERFAQAAEGINERLEGDAVDGVSIVVGNVASPWLKGSDQPNSSHRASVRVHLNRKPPRKASIDEVERAWRNSVGTLSHLERVEFHTTRVRGKPNVAYALKHEDAGTMRAATEELTALLDTVPGVYGVSNSLVQGKRHFEVRLTSAGIAAGLTPTAVGVQLRNNFRGAEVQRIQRGHEEVKVVVRYPPERRRSLKQLASERINRPGGGEVPLSMVAELIEKRELAELTRIDGKQAALVNANADMSVITPRQARREVSERFIPPLLAKYPGLRVEAEGAARDEGAMLKTLALVVPIVVLAMYALMAGFLRSYWKALIPVAGVPMAFAGAVLSHWILGWDFTAMSLFGVIAVGGIIVNDALVLLDRYNIIRRERRAVPAIAAAAAATRHRFRAVFLTSLTTVLGLSPLLYERSDQLIVLVPLVVSMLGGLVLSSVFILFLLPTLVMIAEGRQE